MRRALLFLILIVVILISGCTQVEKIKDWMGEKHGIFVDSLAKDKLDDFMEKNEAMLHPDVWKVLKIRQKLGKSSIKKYKMMIWGMSSDGRCRGLTCGVLSR